MNTILLVQRRPERVTLWSARIRRAVRLAPLLVSALLLTEIGTSAAGAATVSKTEIEDEVIALTNQHRASIGCGPVVAEPRLHGVARAHSDDMAASDYFDHVSPAGVDPFQRVEATGYEFSTASENLAAGLWRPEDVVGQWLDSPPHRTNLENCDFTEIGVGVAGNAGSTFRYYWTQVFATPVAGVQAVEATPESFAGVSQRPTWRCSGSSYC